jgi:hypothetical protein
MQQSHLSTAHCHLITSKYISACICSHLSKLEILATHLFLHVFVKIANPTSFVKTGTALSFQPPLCWCSRVTFLLASAHIYLNWEYWSHIYKDWHCSQFSATLVLMQQSHLSTTHCHLITSRYISACICSHLPKLGILAAHPFLHVFVKIASATRF